MFESLVIDERLREWQRINSSTRNISRKSFAECGAVSLTGSGPWTRDEFTSFLSRQGIAVETEVSGTEIAIIGRDEWTSKSVAKIIHIHAFDVVRFYSQEMMVAWLSCAADPFDDPGILGAFREGHPALEWIAGLNNFGWPEGISAGSAAERGYNVVSGDWTRLLSELGYLTSPKSAEPESLRRQRLSAFVHQGGPPKVRRNTILGFYSTRTQVMRLHTLAKALAAQITLVQPVSRDGVSILDAWQSDLDWLHDNYYHTYSCCFAWPLASVH